MHKIKKIKKHPKKDITGLLINRVNQLIDNQQDQTHDIDAVFTLCKKLVELDEENKNLKAELKEYESRTKRHIDSQEVKSRSQSKRLNIQLGKQEK